MRTKDYNKVSKKKEIREKYMEEVWNGICIEFSLPSNVFENSSVNCKIAYL